MSEVNSAEQWGRMPPEAECPYRQVEVVYGTSHREPCPVLPIPSAPPPLGDKGTWVLIDYGVVGDNNYSLPWASWGWREDHG